MKKYLSFILLLAISPVVIGWGPIAHYSMGRDLGL